MNLINKYQTFIKFCIVGAIGVGVNVGFLYLFTDIFHIYYLMSGFIAIELSIISNFILNDNWTFKNHVQNSFIKRLFSYELLSFCGVIIQIILLYIFTDIFHIYYLISTIMAIPITLSWNFIMNKMFTWKN